MFPVIKIRVAAFIEKCNRRTICSSIQAAASNAVHVEGINSECSKDSSHD